MNLRSLNHDLLLPEKPPLNEAKAANTQYGYKHTVRSKKARIQHHHHHQVHTNPGGILPAMMIDSQSHFPRLLMLFLGAGNEHEDAKSEQKKHTSKP